jgi:hypothetical protein
MTYFISSLVLFLMSVATGVFAFGHFHEPAPSVAVFLFLGFTTLFVMCASFEYSDYRSHHPRIH